MNQAYYEGVSQASQATVEAAPGTAGVPVRLPGNFDIEYSGGVKYFSTSHERWLWSLDAMVLLTVTPKILESLQRLGDAGESALEDRAPGQLSKEALSVGDPISHAQILELPKRLNELAERAHHGASSRLPLLHLDDLLRGSRVYVAPPPPKAEPTSEYKALMARLRREEEDRVYERMTNPLPPTETFSQRFPGSQSARLFPTSQADIGEDDEMSYAEVNRQMALIANVLISILACSVAIWMVAQYWPTPARLALSMGGSLLVGVAEVVVYAAYLSRLKDARAKGKKEVEIKEIIKTWVIGSEEEKTTFDEPVSIISPSSGDKAVRKRKPAQPS